ncbi:hypothetical protein BG011_004936 [Mortierella polycephala]|uniref:Uncharacterized protein n=1 Tax=Mortierella polycephala TaxID=41804 RepID=A0A9P6U210_9FUNG|nr:hypothetical protein BG011_004936 [Mortierella polycephala]
MSKDFERATLRKAAVSTLPLWVISEQEQRPFSKLNDLPEENHELDQDSPSTAQLPLSIRKASASEYTAINSKSDSSSHAGTSTQKSTHSITRSGQQQLRHPVSNGNHQQDWSIFATMSNVSTISELSRKYHRNPAEPENPLLSDMTSAPSLTEIPTALGAGASATSSLKRFPQKLDEIFRPRSPGHMVTGSNASTATITPGTNTNICTCTCSQHLPAFTKRGNRLGVSKRRNQKESMEIMRGYPTGQCVSSTGPPERTNWDEKDLELTLDHRQSMAKNTAINLDAFKMFLNSPLFSNILKSMAIMAAVSLFAISLDAIIILIKSPEQQKELLNDNAALILTLILSILTIAYSCFTIFLESRRPPEGLDTSNSKPLIVIFSEIIASIIWAQVLSVTIYIYTWTYGCTAVGRQKLDNYSKQNVDHSLTDRLCRRQGAMVGLELLLVLLLIFNFYTHLAQNFKFIRAVS